MMDLTIREIAEACGGKLVVQGDSADGDSSVSSVIIDSRLVEPGGVFIAVPGERVDGHAFIEGAFARGAILAVTARTPQQKCSSTKLTAVNIDRNESLLQHRGPPISPILPRAADVI